MGRLALTAALALAACSSMQWTNGVPNLREVEPGFYRGGQPTAEGWKYLRAQGVRTSIKLNFPAEGTDDGAEAAGITVYQVAFPPGEIENLLGGPTAADIRKVMALLSDPKLRPVYLHCTHGQDRTGLVVGVYRVERSGWRKSAAWHEMRALGYHELLLGLTDFWHDSVPLPPPSGGTP